MTFIVEMQISHAEGLRKRFTYYTSKAYVSQIERGDEYLKLNQVIFIGILNFTEFEGEHYVTRIQLLNTAIYHQELGDQAAPLQKGEWYVFEFNFANLT